MDDFKKRVIAASIFLLIAFISTGIMIYLFGREGALTPEKITPSEFPDYDELSKLSSTGLIKDKPSSATSKDDPDFTKMLEVNGDFSGMYIYAEASVNGRVLTDWDSLYIKFDTESQTLGEFKTGGHLFRPKSLRTPQSETSTRILFNASVVPYLPTVPYSEARVPLTVNWFENVFRNPQSPHTSRKIRFDTFLSTSKNGVIHSIILYYECSAQTPDCYIRIVDR